MRIGEQKSRPTARRREAFRPRAERLEEKIAPAAIDLANIAGAPYGVELGGAQAQGGAGFKVTDVGDVAGTGYDDFLIGAPTTVLGSLNGAPAYTLGGGANGRTFLLFGSQDVSAGTIDWATIAAALRIGDLGQIGTTSQTNPVTGTTGYNYAGLSFFTSQSPSSQLGASVAVLGNIDGSGLSSFLIGAPGGTDALGQNAGTGRAYLVYGSRNLLTAMRTTQLVDLDNPTNLNSLGINVVTFVNNVAGGLAGFSVAGVGDLFANGRNDVAIGAPNVSLRGSSGNGAVYVLNSAALATPATTTVSLSLVGQANTNVPGVVFAGANSGDAAGFSIAGAGTFDGRTTAFGAIGDIIIGAPQMNPVTYSALGPGYAAVVYGASNLPSLATLNNGFASIPLSNVGNNTVTAGLVPGAIFVGSATGDATGFAVSTAGDFNADGINDIMIGSPGFQSATGLVSLIYGSPATPTTPGRLLGTFQLTNLPSSVNSVSFVGSNSGALAGWALGVLGKVNANTVNNLLIGSPGFNADSGAAYVIPGNPNLGGLISLNPATIQGSPVAATVITNSTPAGANFLGASLSGNLVPNGAGRTADSDALADFIIGAPGLPLTSGRTLAGAAFVLEGRFVPVAIPPSTALTVTIGVNAAPPGPFTIDLATSTSIQIFVLSNATISPTFNPVTDINPATIVVNGVPFPNATIAADPKDENGDGIPDAIITISPAANLNLTNGVQTITLSGRTLSTAGQSNVRFVGTAQVTVSGAPNNGGGSNLPPVNSTSPTFGFPNANAAVPTLGSQLVPTVASLSTLVWKPLSTAQAYNQFLPGPYIRQRALQAQGVHVAGRRVSSGRRSSSARDWTLGNEVFTRGNYHPQHGNTYKLFPLKPVNHHVRTIPPSPF
ncbi:MAG TPA: integrin alpha [Isosphaeraceae bacterium]|jgi:hypothetical protein|nr:integrin alpha [Isosphaeraceae bacterium]